MNTQFPRMKCSSTSFTVENKGASAQACQWCCLWFAFPHPTKFATEEKKCEKLFVFIGETGFGMLNIPESGSNCHGAWMLESISFFYSTMTRIPLWSGRIFPVFLFKYFEFCSNFVCFKNCNMSTALTFRCLNVIYCLKKIWNMTKYIPCISMT